METFKNSNNRNVIASTSHLLCTGSAKQSTAFMHNNKAWFILFLKHMAPLSMTNVLILKDYLKLLIGITIILQLVSCTKHLSPKEYIQYMLQNKEKYSQIIERNGVKATVCYQPVELCAARELAFYDSLCKDSVLKNYDNSLFFLCTISSDSLGNRSLLLERDGLAGFRRNVFRHTYGHSDDIFLLDGRDTVKCSGYQFERGWGMTGDETFVITFNRQDIKKKVKKYRLIIREIAPELGTLDIELAELVKKAPKLKG